MLDTGLASVLDIDKYGRTALQLAISEAHWPVSRLLISYGADVTYEDENSLSAFIDIWTDRFGYQKLPRVVSEDWDKLLLQDRSLMDIFRFPRLH